MNRKYLRWNLKESFNRQHLGILLLIFTLSIYQSYQIYAQEPTPFAPILIQGNPNVGQVQPFAMSAVAVRTGLRSWQDSGWTGADIRVGVLDRGFGQIQQFENNFGIAVVIASWEDKNAYNSSPITHGTQVLETIHAVAPSAELYACQYHNLDSFSGCIDWLIAADVNVINHSAGVPALPLDGSSRWSRQVDRAARENILWVNAAGNFAQGYYTDILTDTNTNKLHEFRGNSGTVEALGVASIESAASGVIMLSWDDHNGKPANQIDIDLQIIDSITGQVIAGSYNRQAGFPEHEALEYLIMDMRRPFAIQILDTGNNAAGTQFSLFVEFAQLPGGEQQQSIIAPGDSQESLTVGALRSTGLAPYSSRGPLSTGTVKPDLVAPGEVELADGSWFIGTSAAAPVVAGSAALVWQAYPTYTARDVRTFLLNATQDDDQLPGTDINYGNGRLYLPLPSSQVTVAPTEQLSSTPSSSPTEQPTFTPTVTVIPPVSATQTPIVQPTQANALQPGETRVTVNVQSANLREGPGTNYSVAGSASSGASFPVIARSDDWYLVQRENGRNAWIWNGIVSLSPENATVQIAATVPAAPVSTNLTQNQSSNAASFNDCTGRFSIGETVPTTLTMNLPGKPLSQTAAGLRMPNDGEPGIQNYNRQDYEGSPDFVGWAENSSMVTILDCSGRMYRVQTANGLIGWLHDVQLYKSS